MYLASVFSQQFPYPPNIAGHTLYRYTYAYHNNWAQECQEKLKCRIIEAPVILNKVWMVEVALYMPKTIQSAQCNIITNLCNFITFLAWSLALIFDLQNPEDSELKPESMDVQVSPTHQSFAPPSHA